ncbi:hypothetical protein [Polaromonas sp. CG9_12]|nr:hypothetical protein [Polaromonas sp. CG9_12]
MPVITQVQRQGRNNGNRTNSLQDAPVAWCRHDQRGGLKARNVCGK